MGLSSTLVLVNGKRQTIAAAVANDGSVFVDTSTIPMAALERVEILKEGATATYGSDAVAGVANFILRKDVEGIEISTGYEEITDGGAGKYDVNFLAGFGNDTTRVTVAGTMIKQDSLSSAERPYTTENAISGLGRSFLTLPALPFIPNDVDETNGSGDYAGVYDAYVTVPDPNCVANAGLLSPGLAGAGATCGFLYGPRFNIVNEEEKSQLYANLTHELSDTLSMTAELGWTHHEVLDNPQSPSYPNLTFPLIFPGTGGSPFDRPVQWYGRPLGAEAPSPLAPRDSEAIRASLQLDGELNNGWNWMGALTYSENDRVARQPDTIASRLNAAIAGNGGTSGNETFNLFDPSANSQELIDWMSHLTYTNRKTEMTVADFVVSGELFDMAAGPVGFAAGAQWRDESYAVKRDDIYTQTNDPVTGDLIPVDLIFLGGGTPVDVSRDSYALFAEANLPLTDTLEASVAVRYENLSSDSSVDPKLSLRWQATDKLVLRASASSAFREPSLVQLYNQGTSLQGLDDPNVAGNRASFVRVNARGNTNLQPETSTNINIGAVYDVTDNLTVRLDYWSFDYEDVITVENAQGKLDALPDGPDVIRDATGTLGGVNVEYINAETVDTDGIDLSIDWSGSTELGEIGLSLAATRFLSYEIPCTATLSAAQRGCTGTSGTQDVVGYFNYDNFARSMPETKVNVTANWSRNNHKVALMGFYTSSYETTRGGIPAGYSSSIDSWLTLDLQYAYSFEVGGTEAILTLGAKNLTDEDAPKLYDAANFSYDPKHHDPRGQIVYGRIKFAL
ncbi:TonB-dependent receptor [Aequoribacter fuscus]|uniref:TonB-dependent receptor n=3 Tax=Aequoribacter fuscus TaxID=2518989 RepID=F3KYV4_9GAMM|nr:TonB-dependent receptor [Aequoribacter fuscus]